MVEPPDFTSYLLCHLRNSLHPVTPDNARILRMTAAAGTELADAYSYGTLVWPHVTIIAPAQKKFNAHRALTFTRHGWFSLPAIDQYSSLLPP